MDKQSVIIDAPGLMFSYTRQAQKDFQSTSNLAEAAVRILGGLLLLYKQYVPNSSYYEVHHTSAY
jgi:hypothetical protein